MFIAGNNIWFGTGNSKIYYSTNFGNTWTFSTTTGNTDVFGIAFNGSTGFMAGNTSLMKSTNSGANWSGSYLPGNSGVTTVCTSGGRFWAERSDTIFVSTNNGTSFAFQDKGEVTYWSMSFYTDGTAIRGWAGQQNGRIDMYYEQLSGISNNNSDIPKEYSLSQNYPNPFNPSSKFKVQIAKLSDVKVTVFDVLGREVKTFVNGLLNPGIYEFEFDGTNFPSGVYFYKLESAQFSETKKMILIK
jgi:hypothetical protein